MGFQWELKIIESNSSFSINFEGNDFIYADTLSSALQNVVDIIKTVTATEEPDAYFRLKICNVEKGSFILDINAIINYLPTLFNAPNVQVASNIVSIFLNMLKLKKELKGNKPKKVEHSGILQL